LLDPVFVVVVVVVVVVVAYQYIWPVLKTPP